MIMSIRREPTKPAERAPADVAKQIEERGREGGLRVAALMAEHERGGLRRIGGDRQADQPLQEIEVMLGERAPLDRQQPAEQVAGRAAVRVGRVVG
jgi:hypothetical protein